MVIKVLSTGTYASLCKHFDTFFRARPVIAVNEPISNAFLKGEYLVVRRDKV